MIEKKIRKSIVIGVKYDILDFSIYSFVNFRYFERSITKTIPRKDNPISNWINFVQSNSAIAIAKLIRR